MEDNAKVKSKPKKPVKINEDYHYALKLYAALKGDSVTISDLVNEAIKDYINNNKEIQDLIKQNKE
ncbi:hypothetical protein ACQRXC_29380 (plasmid) [Niallia taxi]|uniref:hypothetical protein n=1 Tax=Niallia taxi TaxID=2499688 RepID=UPI003F60EA85